jgi:hypothetical protein
VDFFSILVSTTPCSENVFAHFYCIRSFLCGINDNGEEFFIGNNIVPGPVSAAFLTPGSRMGKNQEVAQYRHWWRSLPALVAQCVKGLLPR